MKQKTEKRLDAVAKTRLIRAEIAKQRFVNPLQYLADLKRAGETARRICSGSANRVA